MITTGTVDGGRREVEAKIWRRKGRWLLVTGSDCFVAAAKSSLVMADLRYSTISIGLMVKSELR